MTPMLLIAKSTASVIDCPKFEEAFIVFIFLSFTMVVIDDNLN